ncbi:MAG: hypothetical protein M5U26_19755 [Planctomycetota bacterium]|nr:hypothetical protein [Planctomycetota bacterium]
MQNAPQSLKRERYETVSFYLPSSLKGRIDALVIAHATNRSYAGMILLLEGLKAYERLEGAAAGHAIGAARD